MRFLETLLLVLVFIYVAQLILVALVLATLCLFLFCLWKRPRESLVLGLAILAVAFISRPIGLVLVFSIVAGFIGWAFVRWVQGRCRDGIVRPVALLPKK
jgi:hypothetical protein